MTKARPQAVGLGLRSPCQQNWKAARTASCGLAGHSLLRLAVVFRKSYKRENLALLQLALAAGFNFAASAALWTTRNDISAKCSGSISGIMTTFGSLGDGSRRWSQAPSRLALAGSMVWTSPRSSPL
jgi:hypothetical protein